jgi:aldehyde:ferredoxin oxidoreductase
MSFRATVLRVDLTEHKIEKQELSQKLLEDYLGGRGIGVKLLYDELPAGTNPLSPGNMVVFSSSVLGGTFAPASARMTVTSKSPETNLYCKSNVGSHFSPELRFAGYDYIVITGASDKPVYLCIRDDIVEIRDAGHLWGRDVRETDRLLKEELGDNGFCIMSIGPAGENMVRYSAIMSGIYRCAARAGMGAVLGSKKLKAIAVRGTGAVQVHNPERFAETALRARELVKDDKDRFFRYFYFGTQRGLVWANNAGTNSARNYQTGYIEDAYKVSGECIRERYQTAETGCGSCVLCCGTFYEVKEGPYKGSHSEGPEWETCNAFGARVGSSDTEFMLKANELSNIYGLDICSVSSIIAFAMELYQRGIITKKDTDGLDLSWGNQEAILELLRKISQREGFGDILAESITTISENYKGSEKYVIAIKGLPITTVDPRITVPYALAFAVNPRGGDHLHSEILCQFGANPEHVSIAREISKSPEGANPLSYDGKAKMVKYHEQVCSATDSLGICFLHTLSSHRVSPGIMADLFESSTGILMDVDKLMLAGERILTLERAFNLREGLMKEDDTLPRRMFDEEIPSGPSKGRRVSEEAFNKLLEEYYELHGWDANGIPRTETMNRLGLNPVVK